MSSIITFYSYKGGVGRSMALANIAFELAKKGKKVLIVDWDLEAPGLEKYFSKYEIDNSGNGLLSLLLSVNNKVTPDYKDYLWQIQIEPATKISFLHSGREKDPDNYSSKLENFDWDAFFKDKGGGIYLEKLRTQWLNDFDLVLIDSRTGLSDTSGICTILLPDVVVPLFTANQQSLYGVRDIMRYTQIARHKLEVERMSLTILPVPTRFGTRVEFKESQEWLDRFAEVLKEFFGDWLPKWIEPKHVLEQIKIPQIDYFSFGEKLAVAEQGTNDPESMGYIYSKIAALLASDFEDIPSFIGKEYYEAKKDEYAKNNKHQKSLDEFTFDVFISHAHTSFTNQWINEFTPVLTEYLTEELGYPPNIFVDVQELAVGTVWSEAILNNLDRSRILIPLITEDYLKNRYNILELEKFFDKEKKLHRQAIIPLLIKSTDKEMLPAYLSDRQLFDFSEYNLENLRKSTIIKVNFAQKVEEIASAIARLIKGESHEIFEKNKTIPPADHNVAQIHEDIKVLAKEYEELREKMPAGSDRTKLMQYITTRMKNSAVKIQEILPALAQSNSSGERLAAIAALQEIPNPDYLNWLADHVGDKEKPFIGYQATVSLYLASSVFGKTHKKELQDAIDKAINNIDHSVHKDPNQVNVLNTAKTELGYY